jgi:EAL domain-containing protein (putative c-di-GMP-specific phosphodiesterase class I)
MFAASNGLSLHSSHAGVRVLLGTDRRIGGLNGQPYWPALIECVLETPERIRLVFQPIINLAEADVAGYEALARFDVPSGLLPEGLAGAEAITPDRWFAAADTLGFGAELESIVVRRCLALRPEVPANCFLTVNVSPHLLADPLIITPLLTSGRLTPLVVELTEHQEVPDLSAVVRLRNQLADLGGLIALDDAGSGYSGLQQITRVRPHMIKLDRALVEGIDQDEAKAALAELLGEFAGRIDAWLLAEGVETWQEAETFQRLGIPLAQGYLFGRPSDSFARLDPHVASGLRRGKQRASHRESVAGLLERAPFVRSGEGVRSWSPALAIEVDELDRPVAILSPVADGLPFTDRLPITLRARPSESLVEIAQRLLARTRTTRFDPIVCINRQGVAIGVIRVERILSRLASNSPPTPFIPAATRPDHDSSDFPGGPT